MTDVPAPSQVLRHHEVARLLPYRWPWLLIDEVLDWQQDSYIIATKALSGGDPILSAHFADGPNIVPGVLMIELVGQACLLLQILSHNDSSSVRTSGALARTRANFLSPSRVGEVLTARVEIESCILGKTVFRGIVSASGRDVCKVESISSELPVEWL